VPPVFGVNSDEIPAHFDDVMLFGFQSNLFDFLGCGDDVGVSAMRFYVRHGHGQAVRVPVVPPVSLRDVYALEEFLVAHGAPAQGEINRGQVGFPIRVVGLDAQDSGLELVACQRVYFVPVLVPVWNIDAVLLGIIAHWHFDRRCVGKRGSYGLYFFGARGPQQQEQDGRRNAEFFAQHGVSRHMFE